MFWSRKTPSRDVLSERIAGMEKRYEDRFQAQEKAIDVAEQSIKEQTDAHQRAHEREHHDQTIALDKMERRFEDRLADANRFRQQIEGERGDYVRRDMLDQHVHSIEATLTKLEAWRLDLMSRLAWWALAIAFGAAIVSIFLVALVLGLLG